MNFQPNAADKCCQKIEDAEVTELISEYTLYASKKRWGDKICLPFYQNCLFWP